MWFRQKKNVIINSLEHLNEKVDSWYEMTQSKKPGGGARARKTSKNIVSNLDENRVPLRMSSWKGCSIV